MENTEPGRPGRIITGHWSSGRCWCSEFHRDQAVTLELVAPPVVPGRPQFAVAREVQWS